VIHGMRWVGLDAVRVRARLLFDARDVLKGGGDR
jgi:hypothetical protein